MSGHSTSPIVWRPTAEMIATSNLARFMRKHGVGSLEELHSRRDPAWFWEAVIEDLDIRFRQPYTKILDMSRGIEWAQWCVGGRMNIVHNLLDKYEGTATDGKAAVRWEGEDGAVRIWTYAELRRETNRVAGGLASLGIGAGDVVAVYMPMLPETVAAMLAIMKIGAIFLPLFSGYGAQAVVSRLMDSGAKAVMTADGCHRRGKLVNLKTVADEAAAQAPALRYVVVLKHCGGAVAWNAARDRWYHDLVVQSAGTLATHDTAAEDTCMLIYTSGTTGKPKGAVHTHCGFPVKAAQDISHGFDLKSDEVFYWISDMGWMMGPWLVFGTLLLGATMLIYDGALDHPAPDRLWSLVEKHKVTTLGLSPTLVRLLMRSGDEPMRSHDLSSLRKFGSTGEPWNPDPWMWLFEKVGGSRLPIINYSGGTEISGGILMGNVLQPLRPCAFCGPAPGMAADVVDASGKSVRNEVGELVIRDPWIGMTRGFWNARERYLEAYWKRFPGVWTHGDWAQADDDGSWYLLGRSDDTIKIAGRRLGPAEVESILVGHGGIVEAAAIGVPDAVKGESLVCFVVAKAGVAQDDAMRRMLTDLVARELGKPFAPQSIYFLGELPKTRNGKVMRRIIRAAYLGEALGDTSSLENRNAVGEIEKLCEKNSQGAT